MTVHNFQSNNNIVVTLFLSFFFLQSKQPSPMCGPFRIYGAPSDVINIQLSLATAWAITILDVIFSAAVLSGAILVML